jgi:hypothetical protein
MAKSKFKYGERRLLVIRVDSWTTCISSIGVVDNANSSIKKTKVILKQLVGTNVFNVENE